MSKDLKLAALSQNPLEEVPQVTPAFEVFLDKHQTKVISLAIFLILLGFAYVIFSGIQKSIEESAGKLLTKAENLSDFQSIVKNHEGTIAAFSANLLLAEKQWEEGQQDDALNTLNTLIDKVAKEHPTKSLAQLSLASKLRIQGKNDEALAIFREITNATEPHFLAPYAWISIGDIEASKGNLKAALEAFEKIQKDFKDSAFANDASKRIQLTKAKPPTEIPSPAATTPPTEQTPSNQTKE